MSNELVPKTSFALAPMDNSLLDMIREELDGSAVSRLTL
mgnify:CR=1 FL=1